MEEQNPNRILFRQRNIQEIYEQKIVTAIDEIKYRMKIIKCADFNWAYHLDLCFIYITFASFLWTIFN